MPKRKSDIWEHYRLSEDSINGDVAKCMFCDAKFKVNATRMKKHIVRDCKRCPLPVKDQYSDEVAMSSFRLKTDIPVSDTGDTGQAVPQLNNFSMSCVRETHPCVSVVECSKEMAVDQGKALTTTGSNLATAIESSSGATAGRNQQTMMSKFTDIMSNHESNQLDTLFAKAIYCSAAPLSMFETSHWKQFFRRLRPAWNPPSSYKLSNSFLDLWKGKVADECMQRFRAAPVLAMMSDGWSCVSGDSHIQFLMSTPKPVFLKSVHPKTASHTADYICQEVSKIMDSAVELFDRPATDVLAFCSDNASNMKAAWSLIVQKYPWMHCYGCTAHTLNLLAGDIHRIGIVSETLLENRQVSKFFRDHQVAKAVLEEKCIEKFGKPLRCVLGVPTRWSSDYVMVQRNTKIKEALIMSALDARNTQLFVSQKALKGKLYCFVLASSLEMRRLSAELQDTIFKIVFSLVNQAACNSMTFINPFCSTRGSILYS